MVSKKGWAMALVACIALLAGCATPYKANGLGGGFGEKKLSDSAYWVYFAGNGFAGKTRVVNFWLYRCAELTVEKGFQYMVVRPGDSAPSGELDRPLVAPLAMGRDPGPRMLRAGYNASEPPAILAKGSGGVYTYSYAPGSTITTWTSKGTVLMYSSFTEELVWAMDARKVIELLGPYVRSSGDAPSPMINNLVRATMVTHEQITFGGERSVIVAGAAPPPAAPPPAPEKGEGTKATDPPPPKGPRTQVEIENHFEGDRVAFHSMFRERKRIEGLETPGTVVLSFLVTPNGTVSKCRVASTTFPDNAFPAALAMLVCRMVFPPRGVTDTVVEKFPVTFSPLLVL
jgi:hypothetical protein